MGSKFLVVCEVLDDGATVAGECAAGVAGSPWTNGAGSVGNIEAIAAYMARNAHNGSILVSYADTAVSASTTGTFTGAPTAGDTITLNGIDFTARATATLANEFTIGASVTETAANLVAAINASTTAGVVNTVRATSAAGVVTFYSVVPGPVGKNIPLAESCNNFTLAQTTMTTGGTQSHNSTLEAGVSVPTAS